MLGREKEIDTSGNGGKEFEGDVMGLIGCGGASVSRA